MNSRYEFRLRCKRISDRERSSELLQVEMASAVASAGAGSKTTRQAGIITFA
jgi:hypothetical protein